MKNTNQKSKVCTIANRLAQQGMAIRAMVFKAKAVITRNPLS